MINFLMLSIKKYMKNKNHKIGIMF